MIGTPVSSILNAVSYDLKWGDLPPIIQGISQDSRRIRPGYIFYARQGESTSGIRFLQEAKERGAGMVIVPEGVNPPQNILPGIRILDSQSTFIRLSHLLFQDPSRRIKLIGITGTNGKTSTVHFIKSIIETAGYKCGLISTIGYYDGSQPLNAHLTTPDIDYLCQLLNDMIQNGCQYAVMEVSSHALKLGRVEGLFFSAAGYTHLTQDHLDFHRTMEDYAKAKAHLFEMLNPDAPALINVDCVWSKMMIEACRGRTITYGRKNGDLQIKTIKSTLDGSQFELTWDKEYWSRLTTGYPKSLKVATSLIGEYQGENIACAAGICGEMGIDKQAIQEGIKNLKNVPGRMEKVLISELNEIKDELRLPTVLVDYSHTPDALRRALENLRKLTTHHLTVVFGCGGDRDPSKRPLMGMIAAELADRVIITSDNPRTEAPETICESIYQGIPAKLRDKAIIIVNRREATEFALFTASPSETILLAGKGAETYQEIQRVRYHYDDREVAQEILTRLSREKVRKKLPSSVSNK